MEADTKAWKLELIQWLSTLEDEAVLKKLMRFRKSESNNWWEHISQAEKESITKGIKDADEGKVSSHDSVRDIYGRWL